MLLFCFALLSRHTNKLYSNVINKIRREGCRLLLASVQHKRFKTIQLVFSYHPSNQRPIRGQI